MIFGLVVWRIWRKFAIMDSYDYSPNGIDYDPDRIYDTPRPRQQRRRENTPRDRGAASERERRNAADTPPRQRRQRESLREEAARQKAEKQARPATPKVPLKDRAFFRFFTDKRTHAVLGVILICLAVYITVAAISFIHYGGEDQSLVTGRSAAQIVESGRQVSNKAGALGATLSHSIFSQGLGLGSLVVIIYLVMLGLGLMGIIRNNFWSLTFKSLLVAITTSLVVGLISLWSGATTNYGGDHGLYINQLIISYADWIGAALVSCILIAAVIYVYLNDISRLVASYRSIRRARRARAEETAREREEDRLKVQEAMQKSDIADTGDETATEVEDEEEGQPRRSGMLETLGFADSPEDTRDPYEISDNGTEGEEEYGRIARRSFDTGNTVIASTADEADAPADSTEKSGLSLAGFEDNAGDADASNTGESLAGTPVDTPQSPAGDAPAENRVQQSAEPGFEVYSTQIEEAKEDKSQLYDPTAELSHYERPSLDLLNELTTRTNSVDLDEQEENKERITKTLNDYGIPISHIEATVGPTVTLYEIIPAEGVRIAKIKRLEDDIAMSLAALGIRIIAPIPGKGTIGIEVPNKDPQTVSIRSILGSKAFRDCKMKLPMAMGATISNDVYIADLTKMPHLLVAGATGMGKSVGLNTIIASLLYKKHPAELKFVLVDPKMVEFSLYSVLERHFLAKLPDEEDAVVTDMDKVVRTLNSLCVEMDQRYLLLKDANVRSITEYNERFVQKRLNPEKGHRYLPYIVMIVDEFADLIMTAGKQVETPIARIAQKARAVGMHMIVATQRPSTNVITGIIKANFPGRIAFRVSQMVDSKTILDRTGANQLIGRGDMLFSHNGSMDRVQCAFIDTDEVQAICNHIDSQAGYEHAYYLPEPLMTDDEALTITSSADRDPLFEEAAQAIIQSGTASVSNLQRRYSIGYNRAGKIMDQLEAAGIVGPAQGAKPRQILVDSIQLGRIVNHDD